MERKNVPSLMGVTSLEKGRSAGRSCLSLPSQASLTGEQGSGLRRRVAIAH